MKILLVEAFEVGENILVSDWLMQPLGLLYLSAVLREAGYEDIEIFDTKMYENPYRGFRRKIKSFKPDVVGFRSISASAKFLHELVGITKKIDNEIITVSGGPLANASPIQTLEDENLDYIVLNEGEITFPRLIDCIVKGKDPHSIQGIGYKKDGRINFTEPRPFIEKIDDIPFPAWDIIDHKPYRERFYDESNNRLNYVQVRPDCMPLFTSRACPYRCIYCHKIFGKKYRPHSPERVLTEIDILYDKFKVRQFDFYDDVFNLDRNRTIQILEGIIRRRKEGRDIKLSFFNGLRGDIQDGILIKKFKEAGTFMIPYAVETASPRLQKMIKKNINLKKLKRVISLTSAMGIITVGFAMLGFPTETREELDSTIEYMLESGFDMVELFIVSPYFGTELANLIMEKCPEIKENDLVDLHFLKAKYPLAMIDPDELTGIHVETYKKLLTDRKRRSKLDYKIKYHRNN